MINSDINGSVAVITIDRAERRNALDIEHCEALSSAVEAAAAAGMRVLVIRGSGSSFCAGADFGEVYDSSFRDALYRMLGVIRDAGMPVLAWINGPAIGAGTQLAIACDLRVASEDAVFMVPTAQIGLAVDPWTIRRLAAVAGTSAASAMLLGSDKLDSRAALGTGLVNRLGEFEAACAWARDIAALAPLTLEYSKRVLHELSIDAVGLELLDAFERCWLSADVKEGELARVQRRAPRFQGR